MKTVELSIVNVGELLKEKLGIPSFQRPYKWSEKSVLTLINDIYNAMQNSIKEYRIGSVVLYKHDDCYDIVDGQQRLTTLSIILFCLLGDSNSDSSNLSLLKQEYNDLSYKSICNNLQIIRNRLIDMNSDKTAFIEYIKMNCSFVRIVTYIEQEAFQFFDSQNTRGKSLEPHDLLKSYHLREMTDLSEADKVITINKWEDTKQGLLTNLFKNNLYPIIRWSRNKEGLYYSVKDIDLFKGIKKEMNYNYSNYNRAANMFIEKYNSDRMYNLVNGIKLNQFQLTEPIIAGENFFNYVWHYKELYSWICQFVDERDKKYIIPNNTTGDTYVKRLLINALILFVDRFNKEALTESRYKIIYKWCYSLRIELHSVYEESINRYALGRSKTGINLFSLISEMSRPEEIDSLLLYQVVEKNNNKKYREIYSDGQWSCDKHE